MATLGRRSRYAILGKRAEPALVSPALGVHAQGGPVAHRDRFAGREEQIARLIEAVFEPGAHVLISGDRGVGKTSLANILHDVLVPHSELGVHVTRVECGSLDTFGPIWRRMLNEMAQNLGKRAAWNSAFSRAAEQLGDGPRPAELLVPLRLVASNAPVSVLVFDEFDRLPDSSTHAAFTDIIKALSDERSRVTVVLVGADDTRDLLFQGNDSTRRTVVEVRVPSMSTTEVQALVTSGLDTAEMKIDADALEFLSSLVSGIPHVAHALGLHSGRHALLERGAGAVTRLDVERARDRFLSEFDRACVRDYELAVADREASGDLRSLLLACALAETDDENSFGLEEIARPFEEILQGRAAPLDIAHYVDGLTGGNGHHVLRECGRPGTQRYAFRDSLTRPYVVLKSLRHGDTSGEQVRQTAAIPVA
jgi:energy-coupling factor transporter ATP-binding protein EcfA2